MAITSQVRPPLAFSEALVADWQAAGLIKPSELKPVFTTIEQRLVIRTMGRLSAADAKALREVIADVIG
jgi:mRNA interferase MazF